MADPQLAATAPPDAGSNAQEEVENKNFRVAVRVRPLNQREKNSDAHSAWKIKKNVISSTENRGVNLHFGEFCWTENTTDIFSLAQSLSINRQPVHREINDRGCVRDDGKRCGGLCDGRHSWLAAVFGLCLCCTVTHDSGVCE
eukprot:SAG31_NODE_142_length_22669_cov_18.630040_6_plen_143_part_00